MQHSRRRKRADQSTGDAKYNEKQGFGDDEAADFEARRAKSLEDADLATTLEDHGVHRQQNHQETDDDADADKSADERFQLGKARRGHERGVFGHGAHAIAGKALNQLGSN